MPVEANASIRVNVPALKAEIEIECLPSDSFWHLKLCLVDGILSKGHHLKQQRQQLQSSSTALLHNLQSAPAANNDRQKRPLMQLMASSLTGRKLDKTGSKSCMPPSQSPLPSSRFSAASSVVNRAERRSYCASISNKPLVRCHSSKFSLSSTDASNSSPLDQAAAAGRRELAIEWRSQSQGRTSGSSSPAFYYGFSGPGRPEWADESDESATNKLATDEEAAVQALVMATGSNGYATSSNGYATSDTASTIGNHDERADCCREGELGNNRRISQLLELDERYSGGSIDDDNNNGDEYNIYESLSFGANQNTEDRQSCVTDGANGAISVHKTTGRADGGELCDRLSGPNVVKLTSSTVDRRLFEQVLQSGFINYGFYSFSLARFVDDQTSLTDYLTLVSSSTGASYYLDLEFKLKQRQTLGSSSAYAPSYQGGAHYALHLTTITNAAAENSPANIVGNRLVHSGGNSNLSLSDINSLKLGRLSSLGSLHSRIKRTNSISTIGTLESRGSRSSDVNAFEQSQQQQQSLTNNMIAKLASSTTTAAAGSHKPSAAGQKSSANTTAAPAASSSSQCKRKRSKLLDLLLNTNWSKQSQQASNLMKLNKVLLVCDANFLDEKSGESPLSLAISSSQINATPTAAGAAPATSVNRLHLEGAKTNGCPLSASLFNLQFQHPSTSHNQLSLQQTSAADISQSKAPLVERILLLLIKSGALIDFRNSDGRTPLHVAAMKSNFWALKTLLDLGASTDYRDINGLTPLFYSILHRAELKVTQLLLNCMRDNSTSSAGAGQTGVTLGEAAGGKVIGISDHQGWQEVHHAAKLGLDAHLDKLLYHGCDINARISGSGNTPLHVAAINDQPQVAKVLLLRGADRSITNNSHQTAHQIAVISNNMDLAEFIASHDESRVVPFAERPMHSSVPATTTGNFNGAGTNRASMALNQQLVNSYSSSQIVNMAAQKPKQQVGQAPTGIVQPQQLQEVQLKHLNPLTLDVASHYQNGSGSAGSSAPSTSTSGTGHHTAQSSLLSINSSSQNHHLDVQANNISPSLSQRSCGTSNTTSSGVCCDGEGNNSDTVVQSKSYQSNITVISIGKGSNLIDGPRGAGQPSLNQEETIAPPPPLDFNGDSGELLNSNSVVAPGAQHENHYQAEEGNRDCDEDLSSSESSSNGLYSLMSNNRPLFAGSIVEATSDYQSGDPSHLQLRRQDMVEVLEYPADVLQGNQLPRLANKPMLFGRRQADGTSGLFPSFCVRRTRQKQSSLGQRIPMSDLSNSSSYHLQQQQHSACHTNGTAMLANEQQQQPSQAIRGTNLPESQSMAALGEMQQQVQQHKTPTDLEAHNIQPKLSFRKYQVTLTKVNEGFGFVLRGAKINPATLSARADGSVGKIAIDERLMTANNLASLQYLDDIEEGSVAQQAGLKRGDFLSAVNDQDVRLCSHENVVQMIRSSGDRVHLTIATPIITPASFSTNVYTSKTLTRTKPEPPKRDPNTTLTRNKSHGVRSMSVAPLVQQARQPPQQQPLAKSHRNSMFATNKPPDSQLVSPNASVNFDHPAALANNNSHLNSPSPLSSALAPDTQSITSISTVGSIDHQRAQQNSERRLSEASQQQNHDQSSSSTTTLTTVATTKPQAPAKPSTIYMKTGAIKNSLSQTIHKSAAIMTSNRQQEAAKQAAADLHASKSKPSECSNQLPAPAPPPPPPPPPLPDFTSQIQEGSRLLSRRTSAPINQAPDMMSADRLLKKRESLAVVSTDRQSNEPAPICAVAAACAAAANNRLLRQQQQKSRGEEAEKRPVEGVENKTADATPTTQHKSTSGENEAKLSVVAGDKQTSPKETEVEAVDKSKRDEDQIKSMPQAPPIPDSLVKQRRDHAARLMHSATLGRKSSAQIIQQPKQTPCATHSQTLRAVNAPKRMSILDYEMPPPPPPQTLPPAPPVQQTSQAIRGGVPSQDVQQRSHYHYHHDHPQHRVPGEPCIHQEIARRAAQNELGQRQLQNQHQMILREQQQYRQQQLVQEQRLREAQQQQQAQHRVCQHMHNNVAAAGQDYNLRGMQPVGENPLAANHLHNSQHHHHHHHRHQKQYARQGSMESQSYQQNNQHDHYHHDLTTAPGIMPQQHHHHQQQQLPLRYQPQQQQQQQQHIKQSHHHHNHRQAPPPTYHHGQKAISAAPNQNLRNNLGHIDRQQLLQQQQQQQQRLLQQQQQQYLHYVDTDYYAGVQMDR